jgi:RHS repeat-associated protein
MDIPYRFTGKERDEKTGLYYYGARYLDGKTAQWLSTDPALGEYLPEAPVDDHARERNGKLPGMGIYNIINMHLYHYADNNPVKYTDPDGRNDIDMVTVISLLSKSEDSQALLNVLGNGNIKLQAYDSYTITRQFYTDFTYSEATGEPRTNRVKVYYNELTNTVDSSMSTEEIAPTLVHGFIHLTQTRKGIVGPDREYEAFARQALFDYDIGKPFEHKSFAGRNKYDVINYGAIVAYVDNSYGYKNNQSLPIRIIYENKINLRDIKL